MAVILPIDVYEVFETSFGKEGARKIVKSFEFTIGEFANYKWATTKDELKEDLFRELASKKDLEVLEEKIETVRVELEGKIENVRTELLGKIENEILRMDRKFTIMFVILFFTIIFLNQNALVFLAKIIGLIR